MPTSEPLLKYRLYINAIGTSRWSDPSCTILHIQIPLLDWIEYNRTNHITKVGCKSWKFMRDDVLLSYSYHKNMHVLDYFEIQIVEAK